MNTYEFTFLVDDSKDMKLIEKALSDASGKKLNEESWGKRLLSYPIEKKTSAQYFTWDIAIEPKQISEFKKKLIYDKLTLRYLLLEKSVTPMKKQEKEPEKKSKAVKN